MCQPIISSVSFDQPFYSPGAIMTASVTYTACCSGPFTVTGADSGGLTWNLSFTGAFFAQLQATAVNATTSAETFTFTAAVTSEDNLTDTQTWQFTVNPPGGGGGGGTQGLIGATCNPAVYSMATAQWYAAAKHMDGFLPAAVNPAETRQKLFWSSEGSFPGTSDSGLMSCLNNGIKVCISLKPTRTSNATTISAQQSALSAALTAVQNVSSNFIVNLWNEPVPGSDFPTGGVDYPAYWHNYAPTVQALGIDCVFDPGCNNNVYAGVCTWVPQIISAGPTPDAFYCDYYIDSYLDGCLLDQPSGNAANGVSTTSYLALADQYGMPFGLNEFGFNNKSQAYTAGTTPTNSFISLWGSPIPFKFTGLIGNNTVTKNFQQSYVGYIISVFQAHLQAGHDNADLVQWCSGAASPNGTDYGAFLATGDFKSGIFTQAVTHPDGTTSTETILGTKQIWNAGI